MKVYRQHTESLMLVEKNTRLRQLKAARQGGDSRPDIECEIAMLEREIQMAKTSKLLVQPGHDNPDNNAWHSGRGSHRTALTVTVAFVDGVAEVDDKLGNWLLTQELASRKPQAVLRVGAD